MIFAQLERIVEAAGDPPAPVPIASPVTVPEWIKQGRLNPQTAAAQPELMQRQLNAAVERCEDWCCRSFCTQKLRAFYVPNRGGGSACACGCGVASHGANLMILPRGRVQSVELVEGPDGVIEVDNGYTIRGNVIVLAGSQYTTQVEWTSGYGDAAFVPDAIKEAIYEYASVLFEYRLGERPSGGLGQSQANPFVFMPSGIQDLLRPFQIEFEG